MGLFNNMKFPAWTMQQLNLDWILQEIKRVLGFFPESGNPGTVLMKTEDGTAWEELAAVDININGVPEDTELTDTDKLIFYDLSASANRKITAPNLLNAMMSNGVPLMDGTGSAGTSKKPARYDHRHPTDTSRQAALSGVQMAAVNSGAHANSFDSNGVLKFDNGGLNESGAGYCKMPDGTLICYGTALNVSSGATINFSVSFTGSPELIITPYYNSGATIRCIFSVSEVTAQSAHVYAWDTSTNAASTSTTLVFDWVAIGRWKN